MKSAAMTNARCARISARCRTNLAYAGMRTGTERKETARMAELKPCPFCGVAMNEVNGQLFGWHKADCFFTLLDEHEVDLTDEEIKAAFVKAWNRRVGNG